MELQGMAIASVIGMQRRRLGDILVEDYRVIRGDIDAAIADQRTCERIGSLLVRMGILGERDLVTALGQQLEIPVVLGLPRLTIEDDVLALVPMRMAERKLVIPVSMVRSHGGGLVLAMADPTDRSAVQALQGLIGFEVFPSIAPEEDVRRALKVFYFREPLHRDLGEVSTSMEMMRARLLGHSTSASSSLGPIPVDPDGAPSTAF